MKKKEKNCVVPSESDSDVFYRWFWHGITITVAARRSAAWRSATRHSCSVSCIPKATFFCSRTVSTLSLSVCQETWTKLSCRVNRAQVSIRPTTRQNSHLSSVSFSVTIKSPSLVTIRIALTTSQPVVATDRSYKQHCIKQHVYNWLMPERHSGSR